MKNIKYFLILVSFGMSNESFSQDTIGKLSFETRYQLRQDSVYVPNLNIRYFFTDNNTLRIGLAYQYSSISREIKEVGGDGVGTVEKLNDLFVFNIGFEKHFRKNKVSTYLGGELQFGFGKNQETYYQFCFLSKVHQDLKIVFQNYQLYSYSQKSELF